MKIQLQLGKSSAFSRLELVIVILILAVLVALFIPAYSNARTKAQRIRCVSRLIQIGLSMKVWANDHRDRFPAMLSKVTSNEAFVTETLTCPSDNRRHSRDWQTLGNSNISYFIGLDADETAPRLILAGDRSLDGMPSMSNGILYHMTNTALSWKSNLHNGTGGNVVLADGSAYQLPGPELARFLLMGVTNAFTNRLEFP